MKTTTTANNNGDSNSGEIGEREEEAVAECTLTAATASQSLLDCGLCSMCGMSLVNADADADADVAEHDAKNLATAAARDAG
ncbi:hypothetical protein ACLKA7_006181 [Drosophila subpalustris]